MKAAAKSINPEDYILSVLSPEDRLDAAFKLAKQAFKNSKLTMADIDNAVIAVRKKAFAEADLYISRALLKEYREVPVALERKGKITSLQLKALISGLASFVAKNNRCLSSKEAISMQRSGRQHVA